MKTKKPILTGVPVPTEPLSHLTQVHDKLYSVVIDREYFLSYKSMDWTEEPLWAARFGKPNLAHAAAAEVRERYPNNRVEVVRVFMQFRFELIPARVLPPEEVA